MTKHRYSHIMRKIALDMTVVENRRLTSAYSLLILEADKPVEDFNFGDIKPGQFVQVRVDDSKTTFLRRPISVNFVEPDRCRLHLLVRRAGEGTKVLCEMKEREDLNLLLPLGNGFSLPASAEGFTPLLVGGGVGVAPLLYLGKQLADMGVRPSFLLAAKSDADLLLLERFREYGPVYISTDDGSLGVPGLVTANPALQQQWSMIYCCGPMPMMKAVARIARGNNVPCEVSLENTMACGLGACLCCVEDTADKGNVCVCTDGPVFPIERLRWFD